MSLITANINLSLLDKSRFIKGKKGTYTDLVLIPSPNSEYGDYLIKQDVAKEERGKTQMPILGNAKIRAKKNGQRPQQRQRPAAVDETYAGGDDYDF